MQGRVGGSDEARLRGASSASTSPFTSKKSTARSLHPHCGSSAGP
jgi:hypothetical protein